jgi:hypothetical protein
MPLYLLYSLLQWYMCVCYLWFPRMLDLPLVFTCFIAQGQPGHHGLLFLGFWFYYRYVYENVSGLVYIMLDYILYYCYLYTYIDVILIYFLKIGPFVALLHVSVTFLSYTSHCWNALYDYDTNNILKIYPYWMRLLWFIDARAYFVAWLCVSPLSECYIKCAIKIAVN